MKRYKFYAEMPEQRRSKSASARFGPFTRASLENASERGGICNVIAVPLGNNGQPLWQGGTDMMDAFAAINDRTDAEVEATSVDQGYLRKRCVRVSEGLARRLHPNLFIYLETDHG